MVTVPPPTFPRDTDGLTETDAAALLEAVLDGIDPPTPPDPPKPPIDPPNVSSMLIVLLSLKNEEKSSQQNSSADHETG